MVDLKGQLSNPHEKLESLSSQGSRGDGGRRHDAPRTVEPTLGEPDSGPGEEKGQLSNPSPAGPSGQRQRRLKPTQIDQLLAAYSAGDLVKDIATRFGVSRTTVIGHVTHSGLPRRSDQAWSERELQTAADLYAAGHSLAEIGQLLEVNKSTVANRFRRAGLTLRRRPGWT